jgi:hypothetical protein
VAYYKPLSRHLPSGTEVNHETSPPKWTVPGPIPELRTFWIQCRYAAHLMAVFCCIEGNDEARIMQPAALRTVLHSSHRPQMDIKRKTCDNWTWKKTFISRHIPPPTCGTLVPALYQCVETHPPGRSSLLIFVTGWVDPRAIVRLEGLGKLKKSSDLMGNRTCDLPACSIVPQPTTLSRAPFKMLRNFNFADIIRNM